MTTVQQDGAALYLLVRQAQQTDKANSLDFAVEIVRLELTASGPASELELYKALKLQANPAHLSAALAVLILNEEVIQVEDGDSSYYELA